MPTARTSLSFSTFQRIASESPFILRSSLRPFENITQLLDIYHPPTSPRLAARLMSLSMPPACLHFGQS